MSVKGNKMLSGLKLRGREKTKPIIITTKQNKKKIKDKYDLLTDWLANSLTGNMRSDHYKLSLLEKVVIKRALVVYTGYEYFFLVSYLIVCLLLKGVMK